MQFEALKVGTRFRFVMDGPVCMKVRHIRGDRNVNFVYVEDSGKFQGIASNTDSDIEVIPIVGFLEIPDTKEMMNNAREPALGLLS